MDVLDLCFNVQGGLTLTEVSRRLGVPKSSAHALLQTMRRRGYVSFDARTKRFSIGLRAIALAHASPVLRTLQRLARPYLEELSALVHETVMLGAYEADSVVCVDTVESQDPVRFTVRLGERRPLHCTSLGKLYLAALGEDEARRLIGPTGLKRLTADTVTDIDSLLAELEEIRERGYAANRAESIEGVYSYGVLLPSVGGAPLMGVSVVGVAARMLAKEEQIVTELMAVATRLSTDLGFAPDVSTGDNQ